MNTLSPLITFPCIFLYPTDYRTTSEDIQTKEEREAFLIQNLPFHLKDLPPNRYTILPTVSFHVYNSAVVHNINNSLQCKIFQDHDQLTFTKILWGKADRLWQHA